MTSIAHTFGKPRVLLPVIHLPKGMVGAMEALDIAVENGADGVFLIPQGMTGACVVDLWRVVRKTHPKLWVGLNLLGPDIESVLEGLYDSNLLRGVWQDDCGVDHQDETPARLKFEAAKDHTMWHGLYFGGTAFKTQREVSLANLPDVTRRAMAYVDVVTTSGVATGVAAPVEKIRVMREALGAHPLGLASGVTPDNVGAYLPHVDAFLVASGIESSFGVLDPVKVRDLAKSIHS